jgi:hypothetical protein
MKPETVGIAESCREDLEDHPLSFVRGCSALSELEAVPASANPGRALPANKAINTLS